MNGYDLLQDDSALDALCPDIDLDFIGEGKRDVKSKIPHDAKKPQSKRGISKGTIKQGSNGNKQ